MLPGTQPLSVSRTSVPFDFTHPKVPWPCRTDPSLTNTLWVGVGGGSRVKGDTGAGMGREFKCSVRPFGFGFTGRLVGDTGWGVVCMNR